MVGGERERREAGMVSAELAVSLVTLLLVLATVLGVVRAGMDKTAAVSVAGALAREAARGGDTSGAWSALRRGLPTGATMTVSETGALVRVEVSVPVSAGLATALLPDTVAAEVLAVRESP